MASERDVVAMNDINAIEEALRELRARMEGFKHHGDDWLWEEQEAAEEAVKRFAALASHEEPKP